MNLAYGQMFIYKTDYPGGWCLLQLVRRSGAIDSVAWHPVTGGLSCSYGTIKEAEDWIYSLAKGE